MHSTISRRHHIRSALVRQLDALGGADYGTCASTEHACAGSRQPARTATESGLAAGATRLHRAHDLPSPPPEHTRSRQRARGVSTPERQPISTARAPPHARPGAKHSEGREGGSARVTAATPKKPRYTDAGCSGRRATSALTNRRRHGRSYPGARVRWAALRGSGILPAPNQLLSTVRGERFEKASRSAGSIE